MTVALHNTLTNRKENFVPRTPGKVGLYVCGVTPYDEAHLGHARCYVVFDLLKRVLTRQGLAVRHIQNFTDIDDKIIDRAQKAGVPAADYAERYIRSYHGWMERLNVLPADAYPRVTTHIPEILALIQRLVSRGIAYAAGGDVYFAVRRFADYGKLSKRRLDDLEVGARVDVNEQKTDPLDFVLWKKAKPGEPAWESPWGPGRPGWHIECSAMSMKYLGEEFDLHGGGQDLIFPHHENEIAQSEAATGKPFARLWMHNGFVTLNAEKMSKSLGNFFSIKDVLAKTDAVAVRYFLLSQHYRSPLDFSDTELKAAEAVWSQRLSGAYRIAVAARAAVAGPRPSELEAFERDFTSSLNNDLNTPGALAALNGLATLVYEWDKARALFANRASAAAALFEDFFDTLGLRRPAEEAWSAEVLALVEERQAARARKDWNRSDEIRLTLKAQGILVEDAATGPRLKRLCS